jgi:hypothetical protein
VSDERFEGTIVGLGSPAGLRAVVGHWARSPLGAFTDVMVERADGTRVLPVHAAVVGDQWAVRAGPLRLTFRVGRRSALGWLLWAVPSPVATSPRWIALIDAIARRLLRGVRTRGSAGNGREEFYGALDMHGVTTAEITWDGVDQGGLDRVDPPVRFGFGSTPAAPAAVRVVTVVRSR